MQKYTLTTVSELKPGDKFVKQNDPNEIIYTILEMPCSISKRLYVRKDDLRMTDIISVKENVIFLKHK